VRTCRYAGSVPRSSALHESSSTQALGLLGLEEGRSMICIEWQKEWMDIPEIEKILGNSITTIDYSRGWKLSCLLDMATKVVEHHIPLETYRPVVAAQNKDWGLDGDHATLLEVTTGYFGIPTQTVNRSGDSEEIVVKIHFIEEVVDCGNNLSTLYLMDLLI